VRGLNGIVACGMAVGLFAAIASTASAADDKVVADAKAPTPLSYYADVLLASFYDAQADRYRLMKIEDGQATALPATSKVPFDADLGPGPDGALVAVYSRCRQNPFLIGGAPRALSGRRCSLRMFELAGGRAVRLTGLHRPGYSEVMPSVWKDRVAFFRYRNPSRHTDFSPSHGPASRLYVGSLEGDRLRRLEGGPRKTAPDVYGQRAGVPFGIELRGHYLAFAWAWRTGRGSGAPVTAIFLDTLGGSQRRIHRAVFRHLGHGMPCEPDTGVLPPTITGTVVLFAEAGCPVRPFAAPLRGGSAVALQSPRDASVVFALVGDAPGPLFYSTAGQFQGGICYPTAPEPGSTPPQPTSPGCLIEQVR
jgi:hypothetical protein